MKNEAKSEKRDEFVVSSLFFLSLFLSRLI